MIYLSEFEFPHIETEYAFLGKSNALAMIRCIHFRCCPGINCEGWSLHLLPFCMAATALGKPQRSM